MFDDLVNLVKEHLNNEPAVAALPAEQQEAIHNEIATHLQNSTTAPAAETSEGGGLLGGLLGKLESSMAQGGTVTNAIEGGLLSSLTSRFGLSPAITGAIAGALPGLMQKFAQKKISEQGN